MLVTLTDPEALPAVVGAKVTFKVAVWLGVSVVPDETPLALNPAPVSVTPEIVIFEFPLFVSVTFSELLLPTLVFAKVKVAGLALSE